MKYTNEYKIGDINLALKAVFNAVHELPAKICQ